MSKRSKSLIRNQRFWLLCSSIAIAFAAYIWIGLNYSSITQTTRLTQVYAYLAEGYLLATLFITPLYNAFPGLPFKKIAVLLSRPLGVSAFGFAVLHGYFAFFKQLDGFQGLPFLSTRYILALIPAWITLFILTILASTSFDWAIQKLGGRVWKWIHRLVYLTVPLIVLHSSQIGTHFQSLSTSLPARLSFLTIMFLLLLQAKRLDTFLARWFIPPQFGISFILSVILIVGLLPSYLPGNSNSSSIHSLHITSAISSNTLQPNTGNEAILASMRGDRSKRYTISLEPQQSLSLNGPMAFNFTVFDASSGTVVTEFQKVYEKFIHLIIVDEALESYDHIHPVNSSGATFSFSYTFPHAGRFHLYFDFQPFGAIEQQIGTSVLIAGDTPLKNSPSQSVSPITQDIGNWNIHLELPKNLSAALLTQAKQEISFMIHDKQGYSVSTLKPYLGSIGHMVMINTETYEYLHVHPTNVTGDTGPEVHFLPFNMYGAIKPGIYRLFAQFKPDELVTAAFTIRVP